MTIPQISTPPVAYLINAYPAVSHSFIRREIAALERLGVTVERIALRGWDATLADAEDIAEQGRTRYVQKDGLGALLAAAARTAFTRPGRFLAALRAALSMSRRAVRPLPYHLIYLAQACRIRDWTEETGARHLHAHFGTNPAEIARLVHILGGPDYSFTIHGQDEIEGAKGLHFDAKVRDSAFTVAISAYCRAQILREIPHRDWDHIHVVHCGLEESYFTIADPALPGSPRFLAVGRLSPEKGNLILLDAFAQVRNSHPGARLVFAGDGPMRAAIEARIAALKLGDAVTITGWVDAARVQGEIDAATALVQPSFIEGLPVVIMEAMARAKPVIATYVAGIPELVIAGETGWLVPAGEVGALAEAMSEAAASAPERLVGMGRAGRARARARHMVDTEAAKLLALIEGQGR